MAKYTTGWNRFIGITRTTITNGTDTCIDAFVPEFAMNEKKKEIDETKEKVEIEDPFTKKVSKSDITRTGSVKCAYLGGTNMLVPCIHIGERVVVLNYDGTEQFFWLPLGRDHGIRLHERIRWYAMNQSKSISGGNYADTEDTNTYFIEFNTNKGQKEFHVHTSFNDGEPYKYDIRIIPEKSIFEVMDNIGNELRLNSKEHWWKMINNDGSYIEANKENITMFCKDTITLQAGKNITQIAGTKHSETAPEIVRSGSSKIADDAPTVNITGSSGDCLIEQTSLNKHTHPYGVHSGITSPPNP